MARRPACAAKGWEVAQTLLPITGRRVVGYGFTQLNIDHYWKRKELVFFARSLEIEALLEKGRRLKGGRLLVFYGEDRSHGNLLKGPIYADVRIIPVYGALKARRIKVGGLVKHLCEFGQGEETVGKPRWDPKLLVVVA